jgi:hypothetical protein
LVSLVYGSRQISAGSVPVLGVSEVFDVHHRWLHPFVNQMGWVGTPVALDLGCRQAGDSALSRSDCHLYIVDQPLSRIVRLKCSVCIRIVFASLVTSRGCPSVFSGCTSSHQKFVTCDNHLLASSRSWSHRRKYRCLGFIVGKVTVGTSVSIGVKINPQKCLYPQTLVDNLLLSSLLVLSVAGSAANLSRRNQVNSLARCERGNLHVQILRRTDRETLSR